MTEREIVEETINYYNSNNRATRGNMCVYNTNDGKCCAFSRMVKPEIRPKLIEGTGANENLRKLGMHILQEQYQGHSNIFYKFLQDLHDKSIYWNEFGINQAGRKRVEIYFTRGNLLGIPIENEK